MTNHRRSSALGRLLDVFGSAIIVSAAVDAGRIPADRHLDALGIDPKQFRTIRRF